MPLTISLPKASCMGASILLYSVLMLLLEWHCQGLIRPYLLQLLAFSLLFLYIKAHFSRSPRFILSSFYQIYYFAGILISALIIGGGEYMIEIGEYGNLNGSFWIASIFFVVGLESSAISFRWKCLKQKRKVFGPRFSISFTKKFILSLSFIVICLAIIILCRYSSPLLLNVDRVTFWNYHVPGYLNKFPSLIGQTFFFAAFYFWLSRQNKDNRILPHLIIICYIFFTLIVSGEKFSTFIIYFFMWCVLMAGFEDRISLKFKDFLAALTILLLLVVLIIISYLRMDKEAVFILARIALQAQLLWSVCNENFALLFGGDNWKCFLGCGEFETGIDYISSKYLPPSLYDAYQSSGTRLSGFLPALPILTFGLPVALFFHVMISLFFGLFQVHLIGSIEDRNFFYSFLLFKIYFSIILIWYAAKLVVLPGLIFTFVLVAIYKCLPTNANRRRCAPCGSSTG